MRGMKRMRPMRQMRWTRRMRRMGIHCPLVRHGIVRNEHCFNSTNLHPAISHFRTKMLSSNIHTNYVIFVAQNLCVRCRDLHQQGRPQINKLFFNSLIFLNRSTQLSQIRYSLSVIWFLNCLLKTEQLLILVTSCANSLAI